LHGVSKRKHHRSTSHEMWLLAWTATTTLKTTRRPQIALLPAPRFLVAFGPNTAGFYLTALRDLRTLQAASGELWPTNSRTLGPGISSILTQDSLRTPPSGCWTSALVLVPQAPSTRKGLAISAILALY